MSDSLSSPASPVGKVYLVGAGPGDPGLLTVRGKTLLECADAVVYDALVSEPILRSINPRARKVFAGKRRGNHTLLQNEIEAISIELARQHAVVVRLKGGDPFTFGRGGEEMQGLIAAGIPVEVVPGVTAGIAAPAYAGIPVVHRDYSSSVTFVTGHEAVGKYRPQVNWAAIAGSSETIVIYMGMRALPAILPQLLAGGLSPQTPIALIRWGTLPHQEELFATLETVVSRMEAVGFSAPAIAIVGRVVAVSALLRETTPPLRE